MNQTTRANGPATRPITREASVVIGAGYGDEGKGLTTDFLASRAATAEDPSTALAVRFNGGAQAGHTVHEGGRRHVFGHVGSGAFSGAETFLSRFFVCHPMVFPRELAELEALGVNPVVRVDPSAPVTVPYDVMINQALETARGNGRHGSCGIGFGETIEREENGFALHVADLRDALVLRERLERIRAVHLPARLAQFGLPALDKRLLADTIIDRFIEDSSEFLDRVHIEPIERAVQNRTVIFEGAQGLLLDMDYGAFPHVTRSNTGLRNVVELASDAGLTALDVHHITRAYVTRHGAGPLVHEQPGKPFDAIIDETNAPNAWQGNLRYGWLDLDVLADAVEWDFGTADGALIRDRGLVVTCLDQVPAWVPVVEDGRVTRVARDELVERAASRIGAGCVHGSFGPGREQVLSFGCRRAAA